MLVKNIRFCRQKSQLEMSQLDFKDRQGFLPHTNVALLWSIALDVKRFNTHLNMFTNANISVVLQKGYEQTFVDFLSSTLISSSLSL